MSERKRDKVLAQLDQKLGHTVTWKDFEALWDKPVYDLSDDDLTIIEAFDSPERAREKECARNLWHTPAPRTIPVDITHAAPEPTPAPADVDLAWKEFVVKYADMPMTLEGVAGIVAPLDEFMESMNERNKERNQRLDALEARVQQLEARPAVKFCGTWERGKTHEPGDAVVYDGGLWICRATTPGEPSKDFVGWQLGVKKGHPARPKREDDPHDVR